MPRKDGAKPVRSALDPERGSCCSGSTGVDKDPESGAKAEGDREGAER